MSTITSLLVSKARIVFKDDASKYQQFVSLVAACDTRVCKNKTRKEESAENLYKFFEGVSTELQQIVLQIFPKLKEKYQTKTITPSQPQQPQKEAQQTITQSTPNETIIVENQNAKEDKQTQVNETTTVTVDQEDEVTISVGKSVIEMLLTASAKLKEQEMTINHLRDELKRKTDEIESFHNNNNNNNNGKRQKKD